MKQGPRHLVPVPGLSRGPGQLSRCNSRQDSRSRGPAPPRGPEAAAEPASHGTPRGAASSRAHACAAASAPGPHGRSGRRSEGGAGSQTATEAAFLGEAGRGCTPQEAQAPPGSAEAPRSRGRGLCGHGSPRSPSVPPSGRPAQRLPADGGHTPRLAMWGAGAWPARDFCPAAGEGAVSLPAPVLTLGLGRRPLGWGGVRRGGSGPRVPASPATWTGSGSRWGVTG